MTIKVLHLLGPLRPSGMEKMLVTANSYFCDEGIENIVLGQGERHPFADELRAAGYDVRMLRPVGRSVESVVSFRSLVRELGIDIVHIHTEGNYLLTTLACRWALGRKGGIVRTIHSIFQATGMWRFRRFLQAAIADRFVQVLVAPSPDVATVERTFLRQPEIIYNWVDDAFFALARQRKSAGGNEHSRPVAVMVGNCSEIKNHELALESVWASGHSLVHFGDESGASDEELSLLRRLDQAGRLLGRGVHPPQSALLQADYFLMPSRLEGMGVALAEALVAGVPALVSDVPGLQWAKGIVGVSMLPQEPEAWERAAKALVNERRPADAVIPDFRASRGAREYADVYRRLARPMSPTFLNMEGKID